MNLIARLKAKRAYRKTRKLAEKTGNMVCATLGPDGETPLYFTLPKGATEGEAMAKAFEVRYGRPLSELEKTLIAKAEQRSRGGYL